MFLGTSEIFSFWAANIVLNTIPAQQKFAIKPWFLWGNWTKHCFKSFPGLIKRTTHYFCPEPARNTKKFLQTFVYFKKNWKFSFEFFVRKINRAALVKRSELFHMFNNLRFFFYFTNFENLLLKWPELLKAQHGICRYSSKIFLANFESFLAQF